MGAEVSRRGAARASARAACIGSRTIADPSTPVVEQSARLPPAAHPPSTHTHAHTAQDLLQNLTLNPQPPGLQAPMLFGGDAGGSIWTMSREESQKGAQRAAHAPVPWQVPDQQGPAPAQHRLSNPAVPVYDFGHAGGHAAQGQGQAPSAGQHLGPLGQSQVGPPSQTQAQSQQSHTYAPGQYASYSTPAYPSQQPYATHQPPPPHQAQSQHQPAHLQQPHPSSAWSPAPPGLPSPTPNWGPQSRQNSHGNANIWAPPEGGSIWGGGGFGVQQRSGSGSGPAGQWGGYHPTG